MSPPSSVDFVKFIPDFSQPTKVGYNFMAREEGNKMVDETPCVLK